MTLRKPFEFLPKERRYRGMQLEKNMETPESQAFWKFMEDSVATVSTWPAWKKVGWDVEQDCEDIEV